MQNLHLLLAPSLLTLIEILSLAAAVALILFCSKLVSRGDRANSFLAVERAFTRLARRQRLAVLASA
jgi:hypothetical protein